MFIYLASPFASAKFERNSFARTVKYKLKIIRKYPLQSARARERERERERGMVGGWLPLSALKSRSFVFMV